MTAKTEGALRTGQPEATRISKYYDIWHHKGNVRKSLTIIMIIALGIYSEVTCLKLISYYTIASLLGPPGDIHLTISFDQDIELQLSNFQRIFSE